MLRFSADFHLDAHEIVRIVKAAQARLVLRLRPAMPDQHEHDARAGDRLIEEGVEIHAEGDALGVHEHGADAEFRAQLVENPAGDLLCVLPPVGDENRRHENPAPPAPPYAPM